MRKLQIIYSAIFLFGEIITASLCFCYSSEALAGPVAKSIAKAVTKRAPKEIVKQNKTEIQDKPYNSGLNSNKVKKYYIEPYDQSINGSNYYCDQKCKKFRKDMKELSELK